MQRLVLRLYTFCALFLPAITLAQDARKEGFVPLIGIPGLDSSGYTTENYVNIIYVLAISTAAFIAVLRLILAGLKYMITDVVPQKQQAKDDIRTALVGLLIVLGAVLILNTINPQLTRLSALDLERVTAPIFERVVVIPDPSSGQFISGENFVEESRECRGGGERLEMYVDTEGFNRSRCCTVNTCGTDEIAVGGTLISSERVYTSAERDELIASIEVEFPNAVVTSIAAVSNDSAKLTEINNNITSCETIAGGTAYRINYRSDVDIVNADIICVL
ncbi:hypothetical protein CL655_02205 [bacterium]|nr:hypothetical protein [bacterium]|tara:strand:- start:2979 stop:3809 length:831 start_codon:yes stop_codon:yes gene_type:complete